MDWKKEAEVLRFQMNKSWTEIADTMQGCFPGMNQQQVLQKIRSHIRKTDQYKGSTVQPARVVGVIGDLHSPFIHENYIHFLKDTFKQHKVTDIVFAGDLIDNHSISRHMTEPMAKGSYREYKMAYEALIPYVKAFPIAKVCKGNHDAIPERQMATLGMPQVFMRDFKELWGLPDAWEVDSHFIIDNVFYHHGLGASGINGAINKALNERMSVVQGHQHSVFNLEYRANARDIIFGMPVGCGINNDQYAFEYGKYMSKKPILGCGIVKSSAEAILVPMSSNYFHNK